MQEPFKIQAEDLSILSPTQLDIARRVAWRCNVQLGGVPKIYELDSGLNLDYAKQVYVYIEEDLLYLMIVKQISDKEATGHSQLVKYEHFDFGIGEASIRHQEDPGANWTLCSTLDEAIGCLLETHMRLLSEDECEIMYYCGLSLLLDNHLCDAYREAFISMLDMKCKQTPNSWFFTSETAVVSLAERDAKTPWQKYWCWLAAFNFALGAEKAKCRLTLSPSHPGAQTMCLPRYATEVCINLIEYARSLDDELTSSTSDEDAEVCSSFESAEIQNLARTIFDLLLSRLDSKDKFWFLELLWHMNGCFNLDFDLKEAVDKVAFDPGAPSYVHHITHAKLRLLTDYPPPDDHFYSHLSYCRFEHVTPVLLQALFDKLRLEPVTDLTLAILRFYNFTTSIRGIILVAYFNSHPTLLDYDKYIQNLISNIDSQILKALNLTPKKLAKLKETISTIIERHSNK
jgi:hypothetical protein